MALSRRQFFTLTGATAATIVAGDALKGLYARAQGTSLTSYGYGSLVKDPNGLLDLPPGFQYEAFSRTGDTLSDGNLVPGGHDGMATFAGPNRSVILVRNHELSPNSSTQVVGNKYDELCKGGTTTLIVGPDRKLIRDYASLAGTYRNCAGGPTPWGSWISCEENTSTPETTPETIEQPANSGIFVPNPNKVSKRHGYNFEVPALRRPKQGTVDPVPLIEMGRFNHEAVAVDPRTGIVYETEDTGDSLFYRFIPNKPGDLQAGGILEALKIKDKPQVNTKSNFPVGQRFEAEWVRIEDFDPYEDTVRKEGFAKGAAQFARGEGIWYSNGEFYFCATSGGANSGGQVWRYIPGRNAKEGGTIELFVEPNDKSVLDMPDNIVVAPFGDLILCEDGDGDNFLVGVTPKGELYQFARNALNDNEFAGACFSPDGQTLFVNIQTPGITFAIWGPWNKQ
ncbi:alkaline phosphatase PhoX [Brasilonema sp. UFV-L1]|uniref:alkaline phosphatase PhoX n=1 Tax=Brasilonema sp. UFV-L1 TaxID=2234130 RepID=UPI00145F6B48|nr:alkaline phosphatase PhoX [Brasilonema sp. UFV-L1]NMG10952.1 phosphatase [Brasilonema sp. UFV-L1]